MSPRSGFCFMSIVIGVLAFSASISHGTDLPAGRWWKRPMVIQRLGLNEEQRRKLDEALLVHKKEIIELRAMVDKEKLELEVGFGRKDLNDAQVMEVFRRLEQARSRLAEARFKFVLSVRKILSYDQFQTLVELFDELKKRKGPGGPRRGMQGGDPYPAYPEPQPR